MNTFIRIALFGLLGLCASLAQAQTTEDFTGTATTNNWYYFNGACLTAGSGASNGSGGTVAGPIPGCRSVLPYYVGKGDATLVGGYSDVASSAHTASWADSAGQGALRFTNGSYDGNTGGKNQNGAIVSATPFNAGAGVQITFKTVTYRGNSGGAGSDGADGIGFYLIDAVNFQPTGGTRPWNGIGSYGGSLGFTCSNSNPPYDGLNGGYLGLGIDEYGNFLNGSALTATSSSAGPVGAIRNGGDNTASGYGYVPQRIGLRGAGSVSWAYLNQTYPTYYPTTTLNSTALQQSAVQYTCQTGQVWNYSSSATAPTAVTNPSPALYDYAPIPDAFAVLPAQTIAGEWASGVYNRQQATPIFYKLNITQDGLLSLSYAINGSSAYTSIISNRSITSTNALTALPAKLYFGFAGSTGGASNIHEIMCFKAAPATTSATSAATSQQLSTKIQGGTQVYFSYYNPNNWTGNLTANSIIDTAGVVTINSLANWDGQCTLTNSATCPTVGATPPASAVTTDTARTASQRQILTWNASTADASTNAGTAAVPLSWASPGITSAQKTQLAAGDSATVAQARVDYYFGLKANEIDSAGNGLFRARSGLLGDIVDSSPTWVGPPTAPYAQTWSDRYLSTWLTAFPENTGQTYQTFRNLEQGRLNVVYVGANDGMLHAFRTGSQDIAGSIVDNATTPNDGKEVLAYMPGYVLNSIHPYSSDASTEAALATVDYTNSRYAHAFFVDGPPGSGDLYYNGAWHTWVVSGIGLGGPDFFALDVTNPTTAAVSNNPSSPPPFSTGSAPNPAVVIGEWSASSISCVNVSNCGRNLGNVVGQPLFRKLHNGNWAVIFGNGFSSLSNDAGIFVMNVDVSSGAKTFYYFSSTRGTAAATLPSAGATACAVDSGTCTLPVGVTATIFYGVNQSWAVIPGRTGSFTCLPASLGVNDPANGVQKTCYYYASPNGISSVTAADFDGDHITDFAYAGDLLGNVWRFDLTGCSPSGTTASTCPSWAQSAWAVTPGPLFRAASGQPITTPITLASAVTSGTNPSVILSFGTGQRTQFTNTSATSYASGTQSLYGVWDYQFTTWNAHSAFPNQALIAAASSTVDQTGLRALAPTLTRTWLQGQSYSAGTSGTIVVSASAISWRACTGTTIVCTGSQFGWYADLPGSNEQIVSVPTSFAQSVVVNSTIPAVNNVLSCTANVDQGVTYVFSPLTGGTFTDANGNATSAFVNNNGQTGMVGQQSNQTGGLTVINTVENTTYLVGQGITPNTATPIPISLPPNVTINRKTWVQLR